MRKTWLCALPILLAACGMANAAGRLPVSTDRLIADAFQFHRDWRGQPGQLAGGAACDNLASRIASGSGFIYDAIVSKCLDVHNSPLARYPQAPINSHQPDAYDPGFGVGSLSNGGE
jgi:hypothetical protein